MERNLAEGAALEVEHVADFGNGQKAKAAGQGQYAGGHVHDGVQLELDQGIGEQGEAHVTEGTDGLEDTAENAVVEAHSGELGKVGHGADSFQDEGKGDDCLEDSGGVHVSFLGIVGQEGGLMVESRVHAGQQDDDRRNCHDTETAALHQEHQDPVAEDGETATDVDGAETGDAYGRACSKESVQDTHRLTLGEGEGEEGCAESDQCQIACHDHQNGIALFLLFFVGIFHVGECVIS